MASVSMFFISSMIPLLSTYMDSKVTAERRSVKTTMTSLSGLDYGYHSGVMTFGYNANFCVGAPKSLSSITNFLKQLLYEMAFSKNKNRDDLSIGQVPVVFVGHSMEGLVVKNAYILGQNDTEYQEIVRSISTIVLPEGPSTAAASASIFRCAMAASGVAVLQFLLDALGRGWYFTVLGIWSGSFGVTAVPLIQRKGMAWRAPRLSKNTENDTSLEDGNTLA